MIKVGEIENSTTIREGIFEYKARLYTQYVLKVHPEMIYRDGQEAMMAFAYLETKKVLWNYFYGELYEDVKRLKLISYDIGSDGSLSDSIDKLLKKLEFKEKEVKL